jgi:hypothetical protein
MLVAAAAIPTAPQSSGTRRRPPVPAKTLGLRQLALGLTVVAITALGVLTI